MPGPGAPERTAPELTVVVPCYNEAANVAPMAARLEAALAGIAWEAVFVDDDSPDGTAARARALAAADPRLRCIRRIGRRGLASACVEGMLSSSAAYVAVIDGDLQHDETLLPRMLRAVRDEGAEIAIGSRHVPGGAAGDGFSARRARMSAFGIRLAGLVLRAPVSDPMSGYFLLPRPLMEAIAPKLTARGFKILLDILLSAPHRLAVAELPYVFRPRLAGASKLDVVVALEFALLLADKLSHGLLPRRFAAFAAVGALGVALHLLVLFALLRIGAAFDAAQWAGTLAAMVANFHLNNTLTYRDTRLRGPARGRGFALFVAVCGVGAMGTLAVADLLVRGGMALGAAGAAGATMMAVWNYAMSNTLVWRRAR